MFAGAVGVILSSGRGGRRGGQADGFFQPEPPTVILGAPFVYYSVFLFLFPFFPFSFVVFLLRSQLYFEKIDGSILA